MEFPKGAGRASAGRRFRGSSSTNSHARTRACERNMTPAETKERVLAFTRKPMAPVVAIEDGDGRGARLLEPGSGKELRLRWEELSQAEERSSRLPPASYPLLVFNADRPL